MTFTANNTGGKYQHTLSACIGACNNDIGSIGYIYDPATAYQKQNTSINKYILGGNNKGFSNWNHATPVVEQGDNSRTTTNIQPYVTVYFWRRTA